MATTPFPTPHHPSYLPLQHIPSTQRRLRQTLVQPTPCQTPIPPIWTHICRFHQHRHCQARMQWSRKTQTTIEQPPLFRCTVTMPLAPHKNSTPLQRPLPLTPRPYIQKRPHLKAGGWQFAKHRTRFARMATHKRLFQRLRRRQRTKTSTQVIAYTH